MIKDIVLLCAGMILLAVGIFLNRKYAKISKETAERNKKIKRGSKVSLIVAVVGGYLALTEAVILIFGRPESEKFSVSIWAERVEIFGISVSSTVITTWVVMLVLIVVTVILRLTVINRMKDEPKGLQNALETAVETLEKYTDSKAEGTGSGLAAYLFVLALFMIGCAVVELFGYRAPTSDITMTFAMSLITFFLINYYGLKKKGLGGRIKSLASPTPIVFPMKIVSDIAIPVSMACRLFGNMLGGMIVMELLYSALGAFAIGIPSIVGLYFNVFHPLIQAFIFVTLTLTFINEAIE